MMPTNLPAIGRRSILRSAVAGLAGTLITAGTSACSPTAPKSPTPSQNTNSEDPPQLRSAQGPAGPGENRGRILLAYFSRAGENYHYGDRIDLEIGNTEFLAGMIRTRLGCDVYRIEAAEPYLKATTPP